METKVENKLEGTKFYTAKQMAGSVFGGILIGAGVGYAIAKIVAQAVKAS